MNKIHLINNIQFEEPDLEIRQRKTIEKNGIYVTFIRKEEGITYSVVILSTNNQISSKY